MSEASAPTALQGAASPSTTRVLEQLFQLEYSKMVAVISRLFGLQHIELAEDLVSDTFLAAAEHWGSGKLPPNPTAWLYAVAKQKTLYHFRRNKIFQDKVLPALDDGSGAVTEPDFSSEHIRDSQLRMIFAICHPAIASEAQIGLALRVLCGFGIQEIASAFFSSKETINKRLARARQRLRSEGIGLELPPPDALAPRLDSVLKVVYLLFNEGYYSRSSDDQLRQDLCLEALRLGLLLHDSALTRTPRTDALVALMCFHASRFGARRAPGRPVILYEEQDEDRWDKELVLRGRYFLALSAEGSEASTYHLEAGIAALHCEKKDTPQKWAAILGLYDRLRALNPSPAVELNRAYALYKAQGWEVALQALQARPYTGDLFYHLLMGELWRHADRAKAKAEWERALALTQTETEQQQVRRRIAALG